ncbi:MAG: hypothetical protein LUE14_04210 [Clostridiales bacterium]|nr:hypothetical protein [Clostridiales bacterium]MCD8109288.1 hypothetical protein [Clostridiales bacterium]MCD8133492.1 hypothetical protein [Clostridiales bacterium]
MALTYYKTRGWKESANTPKYYKTHGIVQLYSIDAVRADVYESGKSEMNYDVIMVEEPKDYVFPDGETAKGFKYIYRWSTNPFGGVVKCSDVVECPDEFIKGYCTE